MTVRVTPGHRFRTFYAPSVRGIADAAGAPAPEAAPVEQLLTAREHEVATLLAYGHTNAEIARRLTISMRTAEQHRASALRKLDAKNRSDIVRWALDHELLR